MTGIIRKPMFLIGLAVAVVAGAGASIFSMRASSSASPQAETSSFNLVVIPQPTSSLQIVSVTPVTPQPPRDAPYIPNRKAWDVVLRNISTHNVLAYTLRLPVANAPKLGNYPRGARAGESHFSLSRGAPPLLKPAATITTNVHCPWDENKGQLAVLVDFVFLDDGTAYGPDSSGTLATLRDSILDRQGAEEFFLEMLQNQGAQATEEFMKADLAYHNKLAAKVQMPHFVQ